MPYASSVPDHEAVGFWSYAHDDDKAESGAILRLAASIEHEYALLTGSSLVLFVDRNSLKWGEEWRTRIDGALAQTTFFIPIITPRYFTRPECRRELLAFIGQAKSLGLDKLILPVLYVPTPGLVEDSDDEARSLVARTQYVDWTELRLVAEESTEYRRAINQTSSRLVEIADQVSEIQLGSELERSDQADIGSSSELGALINRAHQSLPEWSEVVLGDRTNRAQIDAVILEWNKRINKLERGGPASAILSTHLRFGVDMLPLARRFLDERKIYSARSIDLDPIIVSIGRTIKDHPESYPLVEDIRNEVSEAIGKNRRRRAPDRGGIPAIW